RHGRGRLPLMQLRPALAFFVGPTRGARPMLPTPGERLHSGFARRLISVRGRAVLVLAVGQRPHPGRPRTCRGGPKDTANDKSILVVDYSEIKTVNGNG